MKFATVRHTSDRHPQPEDLELVLIDGDALIPLPQTPGWPRTMLELVADFSRWRPRLEEWIAAPGRREREARPIREGSLDAPLRGVEKIVCIGKNYADHAREMGSEPSQDPVVFSKLNSTITAPEMSVQLPAISEQVDFEAELVVVIGTAGRNIDRSTALEHVFGYCCGNDISARDWQLGRPSGQWLLGKSFDSFAPLGPWIVTADEVPNPHDLTVQLKLDGDVMQRASTRDLIFPIDYIIHYLSRFFTLRPGDLIFTGTPAGVGVGRDPQVFLQPGQQLEVEIDGLGKLVNPVQAASEPE